MLTFDIPAGKPLPEPKPNTFADVLGSIPADYKKVNTNTDRTAPLPALRKLPCAR